MYSKVGPPHWTS